MEGGRKRASSISSRTKSSVAVSASYLAELEKKRKEEDEEFRNTPLAREQERLENIIFVIWVFIIQVILLIVYAVAVDYPSDNAMSGEYVLYFFFRDVSIMIFFGFGFLMCFLRRYGYSAIGYTLLISAIVCEIAVPVRGFIYMIADGKCCEDTEGEYLIAGIHELLDGLFCAGAVMISFGALLGKTSPSQLLVLAIFEPIFFFINSALVYKVLEAVDVGGGMTIHTFGAYFGLAATWFLTSDETRNHQDNTSCYSADLFSLAGTLFLWIMWPSFNGAIAATPDLSVRAEINTFLSLCSSVMASFLISRLISENKFDVVHIQNSTLAGGVVMGVAADLALTPAGAMGAGFSAGLISVLGFKYLTPVLAQKLRIQDICGVHNLHGMPGILSGIVGVFGTLHHTMKYTSATPPTMPHGENQAGYQMAALAVTLVVGISGGILSGFLMTIIAKMRRIIASDFFNDRVYWNLPSDYDFVINKEDDQNMELTDLPE